MSRVPGFRPVLIVFSVCCWLALLPAGSLGQKAESPKAPAIKDFDVRMVRVGETYQGIRFKPATGETWQIVKDKWEELPETTPVPRGDYDVLIVATEESFIAFRFDRTTGATWQLKARKWTKIKDSSEGKPEVPAGAGGKSFELRSVRSEKVVYLLRFNVRTGASEIIKGATFEKLAESGAVPAGDYEITLIGGEEGWWAFRIDRSSGTTWMCVEHKWRRVRDPE